MINSIHVFAMTRPPARELKDIAVSLADRSELGDWCGQANL